MKRISVTFAGIVATLLLLAPPALADAPYPASKPKPVPPVCTFLFGRDGKVLKPVVTAKGIANRGICRDRNGNKVWGTQFSYTNLTVTGYGDTGCPVKKDFGITGESGVIPVTLKGVTVTYTINIWLPRTTKHLASVRTSPVSTKTFTVTIPGRPAVCGGNPTVVNDNPNSPTGSGNGGDAQHGFICGWGGTRQLAIDQFGLHLPALDCSGNGTCKWQSDNDSYVRYGMTVYPGQVYCDNGVKAISLIVVDINYPDESSCTMRLTGINSFPLPPSWAGDLTALAVIASTNGGSANVVFPRLALGPIHGTGTTRLC